MERIADQHGTPRPPHTKGCESRRRLIRIVPPIYGLWHCFTHSSCVCNDVISCVNRVVGVVPPPTRTGIRRLRDALGKLWTVRTLTPLTLVESLNSFKGTKNKIYMRAYDSLLVEPYSKKDNKIKAFVKAEKFNPADKDNPDPRMIQSRDPRYNLCLARYLRPLEHLVYGLKDQASTPIIVKCMNPMQRARLVLDKWARFDEPVCFSLDCSRWDKHVNYDVLRTEHNFYRSYYPAELELDNLLRGQEVNHAVTSNGVRYSVRGGRMSGDMNTALGNCVLMVGMVYGAMDNLKIGHFEVVDDGDDCLVMVERSDLELLNEHLPRLFLAYGQELKIENLAFNWWDIVFCQSKITWNGELHTFARNWRKVLSQSTSGTKHWNDPKLVPGMFGLIGDCEMAQHHGIPILQAYAARLRQLSGGQRSKMLHLDSSYQYRVASYQLEDVASVQEHFVTWQARFEFERTWGVDPSTQLAIEDHLSRWSPTHVYRDVGDEFSRNPWCQNLDVGIPNPTVL